jgi:hypothetical protein
MSSEVRMVPLLIVVLMAWPSLAAAQDFQIFGAPGPAGGPGAVPPRDSSPARSGTAVIRGRVYAADTGLPVRKAQVRIASPDARENRLVTTDVDGRYEARELAAGRYTLTASKASYITLSFGQRRPFEAGRPIEVADKQTIDKVDFALPRGGVVTGRVLDEFGDPASDVQVTVMRYQYVQGQRRLVPAGRGSMTNDIGEFRIYGLPPSQYYVAATFRPFGPIAGESDDRTGYAPTYFPGTTNLAEAQRVAIDVGQIAADLTLTLVPTRTARVSGTAIDASGKPLGGAMIMVSQRGGVGIGPGAMVFSAGNQIKADGSFTVIGLAPGEYTLQARRPGQPFDGNGETATASVTVSGADISDIRLIGVRPSAIAGRVTSASRAAQSLRPQTMAVQLLPVDLAGPLPAMGRGAVNDDFSFETKSGPGRARVNLNLPTGWAIKSIRHRGLDVTDTGIDVRPGEDVDGLEIDITDQLTTVTGLVTGSRDEAIKDYSVAVFSQEPDRWAFPRFQRAARPDQDGRFKIIGLPPGRYFAAAREFVEPGETNDPEFLERIRAKATAFTLGDGESRTLDLRLVAEM